MHVNLDFNFVDKIVNEVKSQGVFDQFRKDSMSDVDTKPAYQNLRQRVENSVSKYLSEQKWSPETNKNQLRERLRGNLMNAGFLDVGVQRIVDQVVNPKISTVFQPKIEDIVYKYLGIEKPEPKIDEKIPIGLNGNLTIKTDDMDLLPNDLEAVSPDSDKSTVKSEPISDSKMDITNDLEDDDESPPFEPLEGVNLIKIKDDENSNMSVMSGLSGLGSQDSNKIKIEENNGTAINNCLEMSQESQLSQISSNSHLSIVTNEEGADKSVKVLVKEETNVDISEEAQMPKFNENSNSCSTVSAEKLHFDIKKDEIKFEGTDRNIEQNMSVEQNSLIESPEKIIKNETDVQLTQNNEEISNATINTENSSYFDDDSEKGLQIVEEPTETSQISQLDSHNHLPENNVPPYENLTESNETLKTNSPLIEKQNISPNSKSNDNFEITKKPDENIIKNNNLKNNDNIKSEDSSDTHLPPPPNNNGDNKLSSINSHSKEREHSSSSNSSRHFSHKKHSKDKKSGKDKDKSRKTSSTNDSKKHSSSNSSDKHSSSRHSSQSSSRSLASMKDKDNKNSTSHKSKYYSKDEKSSRNDKDRKKEKNNSNRDEKLSKTNKEKSKEIDDHSMARTKTYRRKSTDSNDGDTHKDGSGNKISKNGSEKNDKSSVTNNNKNNISNSTNNANDSGASVDSEHNKIIDNNLTYEKSENLSKPIIVENLNNIELLIGTNIDYPTGVKSISENDDIKSKDVIEMNKLISPTKFLNEKNENVVLCTTDYNENYTDNSISPTKLDQMDIESDEIDLKYFEITPEEQQNFTDLMNRYINFFGKMLNTNEILNELCRNNITISSQKIVEMESSKTDNRKEKSHKKLNSGSPIITKSLNGKRKRKLDSTITHTITTDGEPNIDNTLSIGCYEYDYNDSKRNKTNDMNILLTSKISPTPSEMSTGSKENDFCDKNANKTSGGKILRLDEKDYNDRKNGGTPSVKGSQRYSSDDLYKPRPILSQRSRRRAMDGDIV